MSDPKRPPVKPPEKPGERQPVEDPQPAEQPERQPPTDPPPQDPPIIEPTTPEPVRGTIRTDFRQRPALDRVGVRIADFSAEFSLKPSRVNLRSGGG